MLVCTTDNLLTFNKAVFTNDQMIRFARVEKQLRRETDETRGRKKKDNFRYAKKEDISERL